MLLWVSWFLKIVLLDLIASMVLKIVFLWFCDCAQTQICVFVSFSCVGNFGVLEIYCARAWKGELVWVKTFNFFYLISAYNGCLPCYWYFLLVWVPVCCSAQNGCFIRAENGFRGVLRNWRLLKVFAQVKNYVEPEWLIRKNNIFHFIILYFMYVNKLS